MSMVVALKRRGAGLIRLRVGALGGDDFLLWGRMEAGVKYFVEFVSSVLPRFREARKIRQEHRVKTRT